MRILAIRGENLASLAREFEVDLAAPPLADAGLFAITGPVGAGKSTLLDAMCLALFDRTPRLSGSGGALVGDDEHAQAEWLRANDPRSLLRRDAAEGFAEVDFVGRDGVVYCARWSVRRAYRKADGRVQKQELQLTEPGRNLVIASGLRTEVLAAIRQRLGLDFQQFCRSVLLAQGEFHAFLRAAADERAKLLETLTGASIYRRLSKAAHQRRRDGEKHVAQLREQVAQCEILPPEQRASLETRRQELEQRALLCKAAVEAAQRHLSWFETAERLQQDESEATVALQETQRRVAASAKRREDLRQRQRALAAVPRWEVAQQQRAAAAGAVAVVTAAAEQLAAARSAHRVIATQLARALGDALGVAEAPSLVTELPRWRSLLERLTRAEQAGQQAAKSLPEATGRAQQTAQRRSEMQQAVAPIEQRFAATLAALQQATAHDAVEAGAVAMRAASRAQLATERQALLEAQRCWAAWRDTVSERGQHALRSATLGDELRQAKAAVERADAAVVEAEQAWRAAHAAVQHGERHHGLAVLRAELEAGVPCPLCGSSAHDAAALATPGDLTALRAAAAVAEAHFAKVRKAAASHVTEAGACQRAVHDALLAATALAKRVADAAAKWCAAAGAAGIALESAFESAFESALDQADGSDNADEKCVEQTWFGTHTAGLVARERQLAVAEERAVAHADALRRAMAAHTEAQRELQRRREELATAERAENEAAQLLRERQASAERSLQALAEVHDELVEACGDAALATRVAEHGATRTAMLATLHATWTKVREAQRAVDEAAGRHGSAERGLEEHRQAASVAELALQRALADSQVDEHDVAIAFRIGAQGLLEEADALLLLDNTVLQLRTVVTERARRRQQHDQHDRPMLDKDDALNALEQTRTERTEVDRQRTDLQARILVDDAGRRQLGKLAPRLQTAEQEQQVWGALDDLIGSSGGDAFAVFAQGLTLDLLLLEANRRLAELARRYQLERIGGGELDFVVVDLDMGGNRRSLWSLSGGETFLVSLALALALATLAAEHSRVETLFLDEGFGTLDAQNLEVALAALDSLQATGCQVGVISHVDGFAERIGAVVEIRPEGSGQSRVVVPAR